jgi:hypothetical protein
VNICADDGWMPRLASGTHEQNGAVQPSRTSKFKCFDCRRGTSSDGKRTTQSSARRSTPYRYHQQLVMGDTGWIKKYPTRRNRHYKKYAGSDTVAFDPPFLWNAWCHLHGPDACWAHIHGSSEVSRNIPCLWRPEPITFAFIDNMVESPHSFIALISHPFAI